jgi:PPP family 3-phenylpropionic acid transporter
VDRTAPTHAPPVAWLRVSSLLIGGSLGAYLPFVAVVLSDAGLGVAQIGLVAAVGAAGYIIVVPVVGHVADVRVGRPRMLALTALAGGPLIALIALGWPPAVVAILYVAGTLFMSAWMPLNDALLVNAFPDSRRYSRWRALLSLSYALTATAGGAIYVRTGYSAALLIVGIGGFALSVIAPRLPDVADSGHVPASGSAGGNPLGILVAGAREAFRIAPVLPLILLAVALVAVGYMAGTIYIGLRMVELGGGALEVGLAGSLSAVVEIPGFIVAGILAARLGLRALFVSSGVILVVIPAAWAVLTDIDLILVTRALVGFGFAGILVSGVITMRAVLPAGLQGSGQTMFQATLFGITGFVINILSGLLVPAVGFEGLFALCAVLAGIGVVVGSVAFGRVVGARSPHVEIASRSPSG